MKEEKCIKTKRSDLIEMRDQLKAARREVDRALEIAQVTASCCETSIQGLLDEVDSQILVVKGHLSKGLLAGDILDVNDKGQIVNRFSL